MRTDQLSHVFDLFDVRSVVSGGFTATGRWTTGGRITGLKFSAVVHGRARLSTDGLEAPIVLDAGDVVLLNDRSWLRVDGGEGTGPVREITPVEDFDTVRSLRPDDGTDAMFGGRIDLDPAGRALLSQALPPVTHLRGAEHSHSALRGILHRLWLEAAGDRLGSTFAIRQHGQLLLLEMLRVHLEQGELPPGWLRVLADDRLSAALAGMHQEPGRDWGLTELAQAAAMSRTSFAERFRALAGIPPLTYLRRWRMLLARRALRDADVRVATLAHELGYASESAFSTAFAREVGESPARFRRLVHRPAFEPDASWYSRS